MTILITAIPTDMVTSTAEMLEFQRQHWFSPAFPVGGYAYSHGIEKAAETGDVRDAASLAAWISGVLRLGAGRADAILLAETFRRDTLEGWREVAELGYALGLSSERRLETAQQGAAFLGLIRTSWPHDGLPAWPKGEPLAFPVAVGIAGRLHGQPLEPLVQAYLQAFAGNLVAAAIRLAVIGQSGAQSVLANLASVILPLAKEAASASLEDLGAMGFRSDLMSLRHETQVTRLFRS